MTHVISVGQLYHPGRTRWPEAGQYQLRGGTHELVMFWPNLSVRDIAAVRRGQCEFAVLVQQPVIWLLYRFDGACDWSDAPFSVHLVPEAERGPARASDTLGSATRALSTPDVSKPIGTACKLIPLRTSRAAPASTTRTSAACEAMSV